MNLALRWSKEANTPTGRRPLVKVILPWSCGGYGTC